MAQEVILSVDHLVKTFRIHQQKSNSLKQLIAGRGRNRYDDFVAVNDVTFDVREGEVFGIIGQNGSGKSTLLKCMAGILQPNEGHVHVHRRMGALLELGAGFHPELSGRENVFLNAAILGMGRKDIAKRFDEIVEFSGLPTFIDQPTKTYSSGMYVRLAFAVAINVDPQLLIVDEILAVGDVSFQRRCLEKFVEFRNEGRTIILVTHDLKSVKSLCDRAIWLEHGKAIDEGDPSDLVEAYTERMLGAEAPAEDGSVRRGSGEIKISRVEMFVNGGAFPVKRCRTNDDVVIRLHYEAEKTIPQPVVGIEIESLGGATVTAPNTRDVGMVPPTMSGSGIIEIALGERLATAGHLRHSHHRHRLQSRARVRQRARGTALRCDDWQAVRNRRRGHDAPGVETLLKPPWRDVVAQTEACLHRNEPAHFWDRREGFGEMGSRVCERFVVDAQNSQRRHETARTLRRATGRPRCRRRRTPAADLPCRCRRLISRPQRAYVIASIGRPSCAARRANSIHCARRSGCRSRLGSGSGTGGTRLAVGDALRCDRTTLCAYVKRGCNAGGTGPTNDGLGSSTSSISRCRMRRY